MRAMKLLVATVVVTSILLFGATGMVAASHDTEVGSSGECGGHASATSVNDDGDVNSPEPVTAVEGFKYLLVENEGECDDGPNGDTHGGYIEAHVSGENSGYIQVCVDESDESMTGVAASQSGDEPCETNPE